LLPIAAVVKVPLPVRKFDGQDILPLLKGEKGYQHEVVMFYRVNLFFAVRSGKWKAHFITQTGYPNGPLEYQNPSPLYDVESDPSEKYNVAEKYPEIIEKMKIQKEAYEKTVETNK